MERLGIHSSRQKGSSKAAANDKETTPNHQGSGPPAPGRRNVTEQSTAADKRAADTATTDKTAADKIGTDKSADDASTQGP
jgi:hypothetical protein